MINAVAQVEKRGSIITSGSISIGTNLNVNGPATFNGTFAITGTSATIGGDEVATRTWVNGVISGTIPVYTGTNGIRVDGVVISIDNILQAPKAANSTDGAYTAFGGTGGSINLTGGAAFADETNAVANSGGNAGSIDLHGGDGADTSSSGSGGPGGHIYLSGGSGLFGASAGVFGGGGGSFEGKGGGGLVEGGGNGGYFQANGADETNGYGAGNGGYFSANGKTRQFEAGTAESGGNGGYFNADSATTAVSDSSVWSGGFVDVSAGGLDGGVDFSGGSFSSRYGASFALNYLNLYPPPPDPSENSTVGYDNSTGKNFRAAQLLGTWANNVDGDFDNVLATQVILDAGKSSQSTLALRNAPGNIGTHTFSIATDTPTGEGSGSALIVFPARDSDVHVLYYESLAYWINDNGLDVNSGAFTIDGQNLDDRYISKTQITGSDELDILGPATIQGDNTGDQTITLSGAVTGAGTGAITTTLSATQTGNHTWTGTETVSVISSTNNTVSGTLNITGNTILGDASVDTVTINAGTLNAPNAATTSATGILNRNGVDDRMFFQGPQIIDMPFVSACWSITNLNGGSTAFTPCSVALFTATTASSQTSVAVALNTSGGLAIGDSGTLASQGTYMPVDWSKEVTLAFKYTDYPSAGSDISRVAFGYWGNNTSSQGSFGGLAAKGFALRMARTGTNIVCQVGYAPNNVRLTDASNATPIVLTFNGAHGLSNGDTLEVAGVQGNTAANGIWTLAGVTGTTVQLSTSVGSGTWTAPAVWGPSYTKLSTTGTLRSATWYNMYLVCASGTVSLRVGSYSSAPLCSISGFPNSSSTPSNAPAVGLENTGTVSGFATFSDLKIGWR